MGQDEANNEEWQNLLQRKKPNLPELRPVLDNLIELADRYLPLHELKM